MRIVRVTDGTNETYGFVKGDKIAIKSEITELTGVPIPINVKDFLFDGWYEEIKNKTNELEYREDISKYKLLAPIPNPNKIICLAFNYVDHAKEQGLAKRSEQTWIRPLAFRDRRHLWQRERHWH